MNPVSEDVRLAALERLDILHTPPERAYDDIVKLVRDILDVPIALVSLLHQDRQWFKACIGLPIDGTPREQSFCAYAVEREDLNEPFIVTDATLDERFKDNPLVTGPPNIRMYVGMVIVAPNGSPVGSLCAIDDKPRTPTAAQVSAIKTLGRSVSTLLALRQSANELRESEERNRLVVETAWDGIATLSKSGTIISWNRGAKSITGYSAEEAIGQDFVKLIGHPLSDFGRNDAFMTKLRLAATSDRVDLQRIVGRHQEGTSVPLELTATRLPARSGTLYAVFLHDRSDREQKEELARETALREVTIFAMAKLAESRDPETGAHIERVQHYCKVLAEELHDEKKYPELADEEFVRLMYTTSPLHDIGKVGIPDNVLLKPGRLSDREFEIMKSHAQIGADTLTAAMDKFPNTRFLRMARNIAATHHERFDGTGYPKGLAGENIPLCGRIMAIADVYDALTSRRVYKAAYAHEVARTIIVKESGEQFDPVLVEAFLRCEPQFQAIRDRFSEALPEAA